MRPLILVVRLGTNLAVGHILLYIFRYFYTLAPSSGFLLTAALIVFYSLEVGISALQAYIFINLLTLYVAESVAVYSYDSVYTSQSVSFEVRDLSSNSLTSNSYLSQLKGLINN